MKRRDFIKSSALGAIGSMFMPEFLSCMDRQRQPSEQIQRLVVIQLSGGNDGLNTVVPFENDIYYQLRPKISIPKKEVIRLNDDLGFNPSLKPLEELYKEGKLAVINSVGYPNPNRSHFRSMDIWHTAVDADKYAKTGWIGRYIDTYCNNSHAALELDDQLSLSLEGEDRSGLAIKTLQRVNMIFRRPYFKEVIANGQSSTLSEDNQGYLYKTLIQTHQSAAYLLNTHTVKDNNFDFPQTKIGRALGQVSQFIRSGLNTQVYYVSHSGFDSHVRQRNSQDRLLSSYANAVHAFVRSLEKANMLDNTLIMTFSEFGRRVAENASLGTDHGKANNLFLIGNKLKKPGIYNKAPNLTQLDDGDVAFNIDFRNIYADVINDWFQQDASKVISKQFSSLGVI